MLTWIGEIVPLVQEELFPVIRISLDGPGRTVTRLWEFRALATGVRDNEPQRLRIHASAAEDTARIYQDRFGVCIVHCAIDPYRLMRRES